MKRGFTLIELLVYLAAAGIITVSIVAIFLSFGRVRGQGVARAEVSSNLRLALARITQDLNSAVSITIPASAGDTASNLILTKADSENPIEYCVSDYILYRFVDEGGEETCGLGDNSAAITSTGVSVDSLSVIRAEGANTSLDLTAVLIEVSLSISYNTSSPDYQYSATDQASATLTIATPSS